MISMIFHDFPQKWRKINDFFDFSTKKPPNIDFSVTIYKIFNFLDIRLHFCRRIVGDKSGSAIGFPFFLSNSQICSKIFLFPARIQKFFADWPLGPHSPYRPLPGQFHIHKTRRLARDLLAKPVLALVIKKRPNTSNQLPNLCPPDSNFDFFCSATQEL